VRRLKGQPGEVSVGHRDAQHLGQLVYEAAGAGGAGLVHLVVDDDSVPLMTSLESWPPISMMSASVSMSAAARVWP